MIFTSKNVARKNQQNLTAYDIGELCIIKSILDNPKRLDMVLDLVTPSMFEHHEDEFKALLNDINDVSLNKILLNDKLEVYDDERLNKELLVLLYKFYSNKLLSLSYETNIDFKEKVNLIKKIKDNLYELKQGKLTKFNL